MPIEVTYLFVDNNGQKSETRLFLNGGGGVNPLPLSSAVAIADAMQAISDAALVSITLREVFYNASATPGALSDCFRRVSLFFRDNDRRYILTIPSPGTLPFDQDGAYRAIRLTRSSLELSGLLDDIQSIPSAILSTDGEPAPTTFVVGAATRNVP